MLSASFLGCSAGKKNIGANDAGMVLINGGSFKMGTTRGAPFEGPEHDVEVDSFLIDEHEVTVADFAVFINETGYQTDADRFGWSGVFNFATAEWEPVNGANWLHPDGPASKADPADPVCQISWNDANAYARWAGKRLPTEAEFEYAARGGLSGREYAWGDDLRPNGKPVANWWQGTFPTKNTGEDGFMARAPVKSFAPNGFGLYDMTGNVWEWCSDRFGKDYYATSPTRQPAGPETGSERVIRGGSFLCAENYCTNYRVAGRSHSEPDSGLNNLGFRCVRDIKP